MELIKSLYYVGSNISMACPDCKRSLYQDGELKIWKHSTENNFFDHNHTLLRKITILKDNCIKKIFSRISHAAVVRIEYILTLN